MPPKSKMSKKRARSPAGTKAAGGKTQTRSSKRTKKDASEAATTTGDEPKSQEEAVESASTEAEAPKADQPEDPKPTAPSFHGNFDLYAMELPFLNSVFTPKRDYAALLKTIRTYQAKPDNSGQIFLPADLDASEPPTGRFRSGAIRDPLECMPFDLALDSLALTDSLKFTARENTKHAFYSEPNAVSSSSMPGITASVELEDSHCGIASTRGTFKMRRAWVSADGADEVFEGFFSLKIVYSGLYRRKCFENSLDVPSLPFWAIRARVDKDGKEIGLGPGL
ncbi:hypothetical protein GSI_12194 [Ganoderma sinense ZZ0214-1]|uniref:Uncharacterized protein n=1 Tax=Ganoderma sinense ZZ0214-1 TaxID=1077348 RepID=A0A2G8RY44_9APHY|nr:hypothetical protein GSI_12194 [Ganoderma sinense ZZ0214-1]